LQVEGVLEPTPIEIPFVFDANGEYLLPGSLRGFETLANFDLVFAVTMPLTRPQHTSDPWGIRMQRLTTNAPGTPEAPSTVLTVAAAAGTTSPVYPYSVAAIIGPTVSGEGTETLLFTCSFTGVEGVLPVH
jgi:hypothetical protein